jgi:Peptidase family M23
MGWRHKDFGRRNDPDSSSDSMKILRRPQVLLVLVSGMLVVGALSFFVGHSTERFDGRQERMAADLQADRSTAPMGSVVFLDLAGHQLLPRYVDLAIGDGLRIRKGSGAEILLRVKGVVAESRSVTAPRTRVVLEIDGVEFSAFCGMLRSGSTGIGPIEAGGIKVGVEITKLVFSRITSKRTFNSYAAFRLGKDVRLAIWDPGQPMMADAMGNFIVDQPAWTRERYGNWLHKTDYGLHSAIDIFATTSRVPEKVRSPVDGVSYCYNKEAPPDSATMMKHVNIYSASEVGPRHEKILFRFLHLSQILVENGGQVRKGQVIGYTGHTGFNAAVGDHLHFEIRLNPSLLGMEFDDRILASIPVNPYPFLLEWWGNRGGRQ